jgi:magnesium-transporting ATPase (P-type)
MGQMAVKSLLWGTKGEYEVGNGSSKKEANMSNTLNDLLLGACLCNSATKPSSTGHTTNSTVRMASDKSDPPTSQVVGDAVDVALYHLCEEQCSMTVEEIRKVNPRIHVMPFNSKTKFMITANLLHENNETVLITLKGAPDFVLSRCSTYRSDENAEVVAMTEEFKHSIQQRQEALGKSGYRVIAMLQQKISKNQYDNSMEVYKKRKTQQQQQQEQQTEDSDLNGLPASNYCFIGKEKN